LVRVGKRVFAWQFPQEQGLLRVDESFLYARGNIQSTLINFYLEVGESRWELAVKRERELLIRSTAGLNFASTVLLP
jgi:hypothetical protein